jgi:hypothetical protein
LSGSASISRYGVSGRSARIEFSEVAVGLIVALLIIWIVLSVIGFVVKGLFWLAIVGLVLLVGTAVLGFFRRDSARR